MTKGLRGLVLPAILLLAWTMASSAQSMRFESPTHCPVGETSVTDRGPCQDGENGNGACSRYCENRFGNGESVCSAPRATGERECICRPRCAIASIWGDPHITTFDGAVIEYHGTCSHQLSKNVQPSAEFPDFLIIGKNQPWLSSHVTVPESFQLNIPSWRVQIKVGRHLEVNGVPTQLPFRFSRSQDGRKEDFIDVQEYPLSGTIRGIKVLTNFGLLAQNVFPLAEDDDRADYGIYIYLPQKSAFCNNLKGLLGNYDGNATNDHQDAFGNQRDNRGLNAWLLGDSFCMNRSEITKEKTALEYAKQHDQRLKDCGESQKKSSEMHRCRVLDRSDIVACYGKDATENLISDCQVDVCYAVESWETEAVCNAVTAAAHRCSIKMTC